MGGVGRIQWVVLGPSPTPSTACPHRDTYVVSELQEVRYGSDMFPLNSRRLDPAAVHLPGPDLAATCSHRTPLARIQRCTASVDDMFPGLPCPDPMAAVVDDALSPSPPVFTGPSLLHPPFPASPCPSPWWQQQLLVRDGERGERESNSFIACDQA